MTTSSSAVHGQPYETEAEQADLLISLVTISDDADKAKLVAIVLRPEHNVELAHFLTSRAEVEEVIDALRAQADAAWGKLQ
jgi:hypothetical protein